MTTIGSAPDSRLCSAWHRSGILQDFSADAYVEFKIDAQAVFLPSLLIGNQYMPSPPWNAPALVTDFAGLAHVRTVVNQFFPRPGETNQIQLVLASADYSWWDVLGWTKAGQQEPKDSFILVNDIEAHTGATGGLAYCSALDGGLSWAFADHILQRTIGHELTHTFGTNSTQSSSTNQNGECIESQTNDPTNQPSLGRADITVNEFCVANYSITAGPSGPPLYDATDCRAHHGIECLLLRLPQGSSTYFSLRRADLFQPQVP